MPPLNPVVQTSFANSTAYNTHRPSYPAHSIQHLLEQCRVAGKKNARIVDLGAGTGIFTQALAAREEQFEIVAVEPHADMRAVLEERKLPGVRVLDGTAEEVPVGDGWADAVFVAQVGGLVSFLLVFVCRLLFNYRLVDLSVRGKDWGMAAGTCDGIVRCSSSAPHVHEETLALLGYSPNPTPAGVPRHAVVGKTATNPTNSLTSPPPNPYHKD